MEAYRDNAEYLTNELSLLDIFLGREIVRVRSSVKREQDAFRGMYVSDADVDQLLANPEPPTMRDAEASFLARVGDRVAELQVRERISRESGIRLGLPYVVSLFGLSGFEQQVLLMCLAPELDAKYERLFGYLHDDISRRRPTVGLVLSVLCVTPEERTTATNLFSSRAALLRSGLVRFAARTEDTFLRQTLVLDRTILNYLLGIDGPGDDLQHCVSAYATPRSLEQLRWPSQLKQQWAELVGAQSGLDSRTQRRLVVTISGPLGTGKKTLAAALCRASHLPMLVVDTPQLVRHCNDLWAALRGIFRFALLLQAAVFVEHCESLATEDGKPAGAEQALRNVIEEMSLLTFLSSEGTWHGADSFAGLDVLSVQLPAPDATERKCLWASLAGAFSISADVVWDDVANHFRLTPGRMENALHAAATLAALRGGDGAAITRADLYQSCYGQSNRKLTTLAQRVIPRHTWEDIILPPNALTQLGEICAQLKYRQQVYRDWGFDRKQVRGKGLCALIYGHSGVGKTLAVEVVAQEMQLEMYKIDLSTVVSKYIGETEKSLSRIFQEAEESNAILFFDEADALFGKRSEVKDAHDRYANIEINYLLQRIEEFDGLVVLATNLRRNIDEGFFRRMHFVVELPFPDERHRYRIWKQHFPKAAPLALDIDFDFLAKRFVLAGGHIRNVAVNAAFLAAGNSGTIHMEHVIRATRREYEKIGKLCTDSEFAPYQWALREAPAGQPLGKPA